MEIRVSILIVENKGQLAAILSKWSRSRGTYSLWVKRPKISIPLIESRDRFYTIVLVDDDPAEDSLIINMKILKQLAPKVPIVISTPKSDYELERKIRKLEVFYYHLADAGIDELKTAIECALKKALTDNTFMSRHPAAEG